MNKIKKFIYDHFGGRRNIKKGNKRGLGIREFFPTQLHFETLHQLFPSVTKKKGVKKNNILCVRNSKQSHKPWEFYNTINPNTCIVTQCCQKFH